MGFTAVETVGAWAETKAANKQSPTEVRHIHFKKRINSIGVVLSSVHRGVN